MTDDPAADTRPREQVEATVEDIAHRVAELVNDRIRAPFRLLDTKAIAIMLAVSEEWVREHAAELGAVRVGDGPKGALRFDAARVRAALERRRLDRPQSRQPRGAGQRRRSAGVGLAAVPADVRDW